MSELVPASSSLALAATGSPLERLRTLSGPAAVQKSLPWFLGAAALGGVVLTWSLLTTPPERTLYGELSDRERAGVVAALDKAAIGYTIDNQTGALSVAEDDLYRARMLVASDGALATPESGSDTLDSLPLGASRTLEGERLRTARERDLQLTIMEIDGVEAVRVHLAEAAQSVFVREDTPPSASVMIRMARGRRLADGQVAAVVNLVAASVPGLSPDAVRVIDQHGRLVSEGKSADSDRIELQARIEDKLRGQLDQLLTPMLGSGNFTSEVQVELDMDEVTSARESYEKQGAVRSETQQQSQSTTSPGAIGVPGVLSNTPAPAATASPGPPLGTQTNAAASPVMGETSATRTYELGREVAVANSGPGKVKRLSVAVALSQAALKKAKPEEIAQIKALVSAAVGANRQRGDQVEVITRRFEPPNEAPASFYETEWFAMAVRNGVALLAVVLVLLLGVRPLIGVLRKRGEALPVASNQAVAAAALPQATDAALLGRQVGLAQRVVTEKPEEAVNALRAMLAREDAGKAA